MNKIISAITLQALHLHYLHLLIHDPEVQALPATMRVTSPWVNNVAAIGQIEHLSRHFSWKARSSGILISWGIAMSSSTVSRARSTR